MKRSAGLAGDGVSGDRESDMKPEQMYQELKDLAEKLGITVTEKSFRNTGLPVKSGLCRIREKPVYIMNRNLPLANKSRLLAECLVEMDHEQVFVVPVVREFLDRVGRRTS